MSKQDQAASGKATENRDLSWLHFNQRVQKEAVLPDNPLLERIKFLSIVSSNMDEFFQVRYQCLLLNASKDEDGQKLLKKVNKELLKQCNQQYSIFDSLRAELFQAGVRLYPAFSLTPSMIVRLRGIFTESIQPSLQPVSLETEKIKQKQTYACVKLAAKRNTKPVFMLIAIPTSLPKWFQLRQDSNSLSLIRTEDIIRNFAGRLFPGSTVEHIAFFRVLRNQDFSVKENILEDLRSSVQDMLLKRLTGDYMRLEAEASMSEEMLTKLLDTFSIQRKYIYRAPGGLDFNKSLMALYSMLDRNDLKYPPAAPKQIPELMGDDFFRKIEERDYLLYHPYHSYSPVVHMLERAAYDPSVTSVYITLYRVSENSPIVENLAKAAENGKRVFVLFEARARFDEENNLYCGEKLKRSGCHVQYGIPFLKVHCKTALIERVENGDLKRTLHLSTGNYNDKTAKLYTDFSLFTSDLALTQDAAEFFRLFSGNKVSLKELVKANDCLKPKLLELIAREKANAEVGKTAEIYAKMNALSDKDIMKALISASKSGVQVNLLVRGICCLIPNIKGKTENIRVRSLVGRNLEHARVFIFCNNGSREVYLSSADWMSRNLTKRVELMFPIKDDRCRNAVWNIVRLQWNDTEKCRHRNSNGKYSLQPSCAAGINAQEIMLREIDAVMDGSFKELALADPISVPESPEPSESTERNISTTPEQSESI